jgi:sulfatase modifying factor 1
VAVARVLGILVAAALASWLGGVGAESVFGPVPEFETRYEPPEVHPEAARGGGASQPTEDPILEFWEDEYFPFVGFAAEPVSAAEVLASGPTGTRQHPSDDMVIIPAGPYTRGDDSLPGSRPAQSLDVAGFAIDRYEVTSARYAAFIKATQRRAPYVKGNWAAIYNWHKSTHQSGMEEVPVVLVTWLDADAFCRWAGLRLPTEAEWEKAARGAADARPYPWGDAWDSRKANVVSRLSGPLKGVAEWDAFEAAWTGSKRPEIYGVGRYPTDASPYGVMDMQGNVSEWVAGAFTEYPGAPANERKGLGSELRVARGNSWGNRDYSTSVAVRYPYRETRVDSVIGFRCARDL